VIAPTRQAFLFGIDVVTVVRVNAMLSRYGGAWTTKVATSVELDWRGTIPLPVHCAALIAMKEATIKSIGGRPPGFGWHRTEVVPTTDGSPGRIANLFEEFNQAAGVTRPCHVELRLDLTQAAAAAAQLGVTSTESVRGQGCWGQRDGEVFAVAAVWRGAGSPQ
jgi:holo-[acyl-carrier protein] synthase